MIDLHTHTKNSDGTWTTKQLLEKAEQMGLDVLSITDHDTAMAHVEIEESADLRKLYTGKLIVGAELNCTFEGIKIEILAYDFDLRPVQKWLDEYYSKDREREKLTKEFQTFVRMCNENGIIIEEDLEYSPEKEYPASAIYNSIVKFPENRKFFTEEQWNDKGVFYRTCTVDKSFVLYKDFSDQVPNLETVTNLVHKYNGKVFLAHVYQYKLDNYIEFLDKLVDEKLIDGIEVFHSSFSQKQTDTLLEYCQRKKILMSGGSDCHGERKKDRKLGVGYDNLKIDKKIIDNWG